jgi:hypothetical protein
LEGGYGEGKIESSQSGFKDMKQGGVRGVRGESGGTYEGNRAVGFEEGRWCY